MFIHTRFFLTCCSTCHSICDRGGKLFAILASKIKAVITSRSKQFPPFVEFRAWEVDPAQDKVGCRIFLHAHLLLANKPWHPGELDLRIRSRLSLGVSFMKGSRVVPPVANLKGQANLKVQAKLRLQHQRLRHGSDSSGGHRF